MMQAQNAALFLGQIPNPQTGKPEVNLGVARMFIDQLVMIQEKTRGNLTNDEKTVLTNAISGLQMAFVEASQGGETISQTAAAAAEEAQEPDSPITDGGGSTVDSPSPTGESEQKKRFTKSYGS
jgi:hypothetical protein